MKRSLISLLMMMVLSTPFTLHAAGEKVSTIVIDPGHGGKDAGAVGKNCYEKDIALKVALKFGELINQNFPDVKVIYTRKDDRFVELRQRGRIANQNHADLFVSIHCNSTDGKEAKGVETWIMGNHKNDANLKVAQLENSAILQEQDHEANYDNFDPNSPDAYIIFSLYQNAFMDQSLGFAAKVQEQYSQRVPSPNRGIKQAGFLVLWSCALPSVLTEIGFISNPTEEKFLNSAEGQLKIATSLFNAFKEYKYQVEGFNNQADAVKTPTAAAKPTAPAAKPATATTEPAKPVTTPTAPAKPAVEPAKPATEPTKPVTAPTAPAKPTTEPTKPVTAPTAPAKPAVEPAKPTDVPSAASVLRDTAHTQTVVESGAPEPPAATKPDTTRPALPQATAPAPGPAPDTARPQPAPTAVAPTPAPITPVPATAPASTATAIPAMRHDTMAPRLVFKIQFASSSTDKDLNAPEFKNLNLPPLSKYQENGLFKYCCGEADTPEAAQKILRQVQDAGFKDAFMVVFSDGQRISTQEAYRILQERNK